MRRPGFLGGASYWFGSLGDNCMVCNGNVCKNVCSTAKQKAIIKKRNKKIRSVASKTKMRQVTPSTNKAAFAMRKGEGQQARLRRLSAAGLYTSGGKMSIDYGNLVHFGTTDRLRIKKIKQERAAWQRKENLKRYGTTNIHAITGMVAEDKAATEAMWLRLFGTKDPDKVYAIPDAKRKSMCDADAECLRLMNKAQGKKKALSGFSGFLGNLISSLR